VVTALSIYRKPPFWVVAVGGPSSSRVGWRLLCQSCAVLLVVPGSLEVRIIMYMCMSV
jgi:hypothetical protein